MEIKVNGEVKALDNGPMSVLDLLARNKVAMPDMVSVQINGAFVDRSAYATHQVNEGDEIEFLYFMGGGAR